LFRSGTLPAKGLELVVEKRRLCGNRSPESALAILQKSPPAAVWTHDQTHATASTNSPFADANFLDRHYVKPLENSAGHLWVAAEITNAPEKSALKKESNDAKTPKKGPIAWSVESNRKKRMCLKN
jgi:hypothetical protein